MNKGVLATIAVFVTIIGLVVGTAIVSYISAYNYGNLTENSIKAVYESNKAILSTHSNKLFEIVQVPTMKTEDLVKVSTAAMEGRYGNDGSKAVFQWIQENYPGQVTDELYVKISQTIEAGRNKFENGQMKLIREKQLYETELGYLWRGFWLNVAGYPKIDLDKYVIVTSDYTNSAFEKKIENGIKLR